VKCRYAPAADYPQGNEGREDCGQQRQHYGRQVVINAHWQPKGYAVVGLDDRVGFPNGRFETDSETLFES